ncbi:hypothetical protein CDAR_212071 [Caerostris darwini]|uniref:Uncharacterized protein n=1 Tax=Caerostris darwini TaxID=1538125 RepID=A0AAV4NT45_9ARAC|nr:hypothetical protein CDAR_212071 [Caerostris darwini]
MLWNPASKADSYNIQVECCGILELCILFFFNLLNANIKNYLDYKFLAVKVIRQDVNYLQKFHSCLENSGHGTENCFHVSSDGTNVLLSNLKPNSEVLIVHLYAHSVTKTPISKNTRKSNSSQKKKLSLNRQISTSESNLDKIAKKKEYPSFAPFGESSKHGTKGTKTPYSKNIRKSNSSQKKRALLNIQISTSDSNLDKLAKDKRYPSFAHLNEPYKQGTNKKTLVSVLFQNQSTSEEIETLDKSSSVSHVKQSLRFTDISLPDPLLYQGTKELSMIQNLRDAASIIAELANELDAVDEFFEKRGHKLASICEHCGTVKKSRRISESDSGCESSATTRERYKELKRKLKLSRVQESENHQAALIEMNDWEQWNLESQIPKEFTILTPKTASTLPDYGKFEDILALVRKLLEKMNDYKKGLIKDARKVCTGFNIAESTNDPGQLVTNLQNFPDQSAHIIPPVTETDLTTSNTETEKSKLFEKYLIFRASPIDHLNSEMGPQTQNVSLSDDQHDANHDPLKDAVRAVKDKYLSDLLDLMEELDLSNTSDTISKYDFRTRIENLALRMAQDILEANANACSC